MTVTLVIFWEAGAAGGGGGGFAARGASGPREEEQPRTMEAKKEMASADRARDETLEIGSGMANLILNWLL